MSTQSTEKNLWETLKSKNVVEGELPTLEEQDTPWAIRVMQGFAGWIASIFLLGTLATMFAWIFDSDNSLVIITVGLMCNGAASLIFNKNKNDFLNQLSLAFNLCGQLVVAWGIYELLDSVKADYFFSLMFYQLTLLFVVNDFSSRVLTTWFSMVALTIALAHLGVVYVSTAIVSVLFLIVWLNDLHWKQSKKLWDPVGYGLAIALLQLNGQMLFGGGAENWFDINIIEWLAEYSFWISEGLIAAGLVSLLFKLMNQYKILWLSRSGVLLMAVSALIIIINYYIVGLIACFLLLMVGFLKRRTVLIGLGIIALFVFISGYYYYLEETLLIKSFMLIGFGSCFLLGYFILHKQTILLSEKSNKETSNQFSLYIKMNSQKWMTLASLAFILLAVNFNIFKKEQLLEDGEIVLLELAPVDPRSLMQGDYMRLRFAIEQNLIDDNSLLESHKNQSEQYFIVERDEHKVGQFSHRYKGEALSKNQIKMQFRVRNNKIRLATHAFFFQEGTAKEYEKARYGEFRVASNGELLLNNLRDESFHILGFNRP